MAASDTSRQAPVKAPPTPSIDPRSDEILLAFGEGPLGYAVPARDLHGNDLARIARVRALAASDGQPIEPASAEQLSSLYEELVASGTFTAYEPAPASLEAAPPAPVTAIPDQPPVVAATEA